jgi:ABC-type bacteriocin/lantibiotic exporter with double-glycine peptidase domain
MQIILSIILVALSIILIQSGQVFAGIFFILLAIVSISGIFLEKLIRFMKSAFGELKNSLGEQIDLFKSAKTKSNSGRKFFEESFKTIGKEIGKSEKARIQHKKIKSTFGIESFSSIAENLLQGIGKLMKK